MKNEELIYKINNLMESFDPYEYEEQAEERNMLEYIEEAIENDIESVKDYLKMIIDECEIFYVVENAKEILNEL